MSSTKSTLPDWAKPNGASKPASPAAGETPYTLSKDMLALALCTVFAFGLMTFGVGWWLSKKVTTQALDAKYQVEIKRITRPMMGGGGIASAAPTLGNTAAIPSPLTQQTTTPQTPSTQHPAAQAPAVELTKDPREAGLNYIRLCQVPQVQAEKYAQFLASQGGKTWRAPATHKGMVVIYAVDKGFALKDHESRVALEKYRASLLALGDKWAKKNKCGNPFKSCYPEKFNP